jgi:hypothetical protein
MIVVKPQFLSLEGLIQSSQALGIGRGVLEKSVYALLGYLAESGLPFVFKGDTSQLLHLDRPCRLSIDIDIFRHAAPAELDAVLARTGELPPFQSRGTGSRRTRLLAWGICLEGLGHGSQSWPTRSGSPWARP